MKQQTIILSYLILFVTNLRTLLIIFSTGEVNGSRFVISIITRQRPHGEFILPLLADYKE